MVKLTALYGHPEDPAAFEGYYANTHMALADKIPNFQRYEAARISPRPTAPRRLLPHLRDVLR